MPTEIFLIGAGGHGKVVLDALLSSGIPVDAIRVLDGDATRNGQDFLGFPIRTGVPPIGLGVSFHVSVGDGGVRERLFTALVGSGGLPFSILHPKTVVSRFASVGEGSFLAAQSIVGPSAVLGRGVIVNHGAVVDHDCIVGDFCHIAPGATLGGKVQIGPRVLVGAGANLLPGVRVGADAVIGAGAVVVRDVAGGMTVAGIPAAQLQT